MAILSEHDKVYRESVHETFEKLKVVYADISKNYKFDLSKVEVTEAILNRLKAFYLTQFATKEFLEKGIIPNAADYFVETTLFFLKLFLKENAPHLKAESERAIERKRGSIRPDITVWNKNKVVAIIECKTQLGYNRNSWELDFISRDQKLKASYPMAKAFLLVSTSDNWGGFGNNPNVGKTYFSLLDAGIRAFSYTNTNQILNPVEGIFKQLLL